MRAQPVTPSWADKNHFLLEIPSDGKIKYLNIAGISWDQFLSFGV